MYLLDMIYSKGMYGVVWVVVETYTGYKISPEAIQPPYYTQPPIPSSCSTSPKTLLTVLPQSRDDDIQPTQPGKKKAVYKSSNTVLDLIYTRMSTRAYQRHRHRHSVQDTAVAGEEITQ